VVSVAAWLASLVALLLAHPTHTSSAELAAEADSLRIEVRVFAEDAPPGDIGAYVAGRLRILDGSGRRVRLAPRETARAGDLLTVKLAGRLHGSLSGGSVENAILTDRFADQVNVVRATYGRRTATLIFVRGDGPKALP
jgi:hypothetical protein